MKLQRFCQLIGVLLIAAFISIWADSWIRFYQEHGRLPYGDFDSEEVTLFPDKPRHTAAKRDQEVVYSLENVSEPQFYCWMLGAVVVFGLVLWKCPFNPEPDVD